MFGGRRKREGSRSSLISLVGALFSNILYKHFGPRTVRSWTQDSSAPTDCSRRVKMVWQQCRSVRETFRGGIGPNCLELSWLTPNTLFSYMLSLVRLSVICRLSICNVPGFTAFSLPGQFAPWSESANRTLAISLPGTVAPWPFCSLELSFPGANWPGNFAPWNFLVFLLHNFFV